MGNNIFWKFPKTDGGSEDGFNEAGIATFMGAKFPSLAREIIQNSLDARVGLDAVNPVRVEFRTRKIPVKDFPGGAQMLEIFKKCREKSKEISDSKADKFFEKGIHLLKEAEVNFLQIADYNTTGLTEKPNNLWYKLIKARGVSGKSARAGGSFGIGKYAPYTISDLRTVFYSTMHLDEKGGIVRKAQGRAVLITHTDKNGDATQGNGFYGEQNKNCEPIPENKIPAFLRRAKQGTTVSIAGFNAEHDWKKQIAQAVASNFFVAIKKGRLHVSIEGMEDITADTLPKHFEKLTPDAATPGNEDFAGIKVARQMYDAMENGEKRDMELRQLGHCELWVMSGEGLPKSVGIVRDTGMMITTESMNLKRFAGFGDFVAICICTSEKGNALLRGMENPKHDAFEPDRLEEDKKKGERALKELAKEIRARIKEIVVPDEQDRVNAKEMADFFPSEGEEDAGANKDSDDFDFEAEPLITKKPRKAKTKATDSNSSENEDEEQHENEGEENGGGGGGGGGGGSNKDSEHSGRKSISAAINNIRVVKRPGAGNEYLVYFTSKEDAKIDLVFKVAGDQRTDSLPLPPEVTNRAKNIKVKKGERVCFPLEVGHNIQGAIHIAAYKEDSAKSSPKEGGKQ